MLKLLDLPDDHVMAVPPGRVVAEIDVSVLDGRGVERLLREVGSCQAQLDGLRTRAVQRLRELKAAAGQRQSGDGGRDGGGDGGGDVADRVAAAAGQSRAQARKTERHAQARPELARAAEALDRGEITLEHFDALAVNNRGIVTEHLDELVVTARHLPVDRFRRYLARFCDLAAADAGADRARQLHAQRFARFSMPDVNRLGFLNAGWAPDQWATVRSAANAITESSWHATHPDGHARPSDDDRTWEQRLADAIVEMAQRSLSGWHPIDNAANPPESTPSPAQSSSQPRTGSGVTGVTNTTFAEPVLRSRAAEQNQPGQPDQRSGSTESSGNEPGPSVHKSTEPGDTLDERTYRFDATGLRAPPRARAPGPGHVEAANPAPSVPRTSNFPYFPHQSRAELVVIIDYDTLIGQLHREGTIVGGGPISAATARRLACDADLIPVVLGGDSVVLDLGRGRRVATADQRRALVARDGPTCAVPGCLVPADRCRAHHLLPFFVGGCTDLAVLVLVCDRHHHDLHEGGARLHRMHGRWRLEPRPPPSPTASRAESQDVGKPSTGSHGSQGPGADCGAALATRANGMGEALDQCRRVG